MQAEVKYKPSKIMALVACAVASPFLAIPMVLLLGELWAESVVGYLLLGVPLFLGVLLILKLPISKNWHIAILWPYTALLLLPYAFTMFYLIFSFVYFVFLMYVHDWILG